jgi:hypothetical protein
MSAYGAPTFCANLRTSFTRPASGAMITRSSPRSRSSTNCVRIGIAVMWSTGFEKKPCSWPAWRSIVTSRSMPATSSVSATRRAEMGSRGEDFLSWRE